MMCSENELRDYLAEVCPDALMFENPSFNDAIVGISSDGALVYSMDLMCEQFARENECDYMEALDFITYNTLRAIGYASGGVKPVVIESEFFEYMERGF